VPFTADFLCNIRSRSTGKKCSQKSQRKDQARLEEQARRKAAADSIAAARAMVDSIAASKQRRDSIPMTRAQLDTSKTAPQIVKPAVLLQYSAGRQTRSKPVRPRRRIPCAKILHSFTPSGWWNKKMIQEMLPVVAERRNRRGYFSANASFRNKLPQRRKPASS